MSADRVVVVGSGASGVHFAHALLQQGRAVTMVDVGHQGQPAPEPQATLAELKERLANAPDYFLGHDFEGVLLPGDGGEYYGIPPSKDHVLDAAEGAGMRLRGFAPLHSFARGGLAEVWTGGCYPFSDRDLKDFPFTIRDLLPFYSEVARHIGVSGVEDDLADYMPIHDHLQAPLELDTHSRQLLEKSRQRQRALQAAGWVLGRSRSAVLSSPLGRRRECAYLGRCLWGCPNGAFYTPAQTLAVCLENGRFTYMPGHRVTHFRCDDGGRVRALEALRLADGETIEMPVDRLALAAGTLGSTRIVLASMRRQGIRTPRLAGLMDNRQVLVPFVNLRRVGQRFDDASYQYHQLAMAMDTPNPVNSVFALITTLNTALVHPIARSLPFDLRTALNITRRMHAALGLVNVNFPDTRREECCIMLGDRQGGEAVLHVDYAPPADEPSRLRQALRRVRSALHTLGCVVPPGMVHVRPMGASVHYAGTLPMSREPRPWTTDAHCRSHDFPNLWLLDGSTLPFLPAKNVTFTLMANARRVAAADF